MTAAFFGDDWLMQVLLACVCYVGVLLNATTVAVRGLAREPMQALAMLVFVALLPIPAAPAGLWLFQFALLLLTLGSIGALQLRFALARSRVVQAYESSARASPVGMGMTILLFIPVLVLAGIPIASALRALPEANPWTSPVSATEMQVALTKGTLSVLLVALLFAAYVAIAWRIDQAWLRVVGRIRLMSSDARFVWINLFMAASSTVSVTLIIFCGVESAAGRFSLVAIAALSLIPAINGLSWTYDAVFRRLLTFHILLALAGALVLGVRMVMDWLSLAPIASTPLALGSLAVAAVMLPERIDAVLERWLFPRTSEMRARLLAIAGEALTATNRADAADELLRRLVSVLDSAGGVAVVHATDSEAAALRVVGDVDATALGNTPTEVETYVSALANVTVPRLIENLSLAHQIRLLRCGVVLVCPLVGREPQAVFLLAPRRGWLYDVATVNALRVFSSQAGLALENLALASARAHAEKLAALGEAAARIAHEIRNPLTAARSLVQQAANADGVADLAGPAVEELDRIGRLVADLLAFARRDEVQTRAPVDLASVCRNAVVQVAPLAKQAGVDIATDVAPVIVAGDQTRLVQVVANLCRNAIEALAEHTPPRRVVVDCAAETGAATITVRDNGPGIPRAELARIFEPFSTSKSAGTGLGLPIARRIVEAHGGRLAVESVPGATTVFRVDLPLAHGKVVSVE